MNYTIIGYGIYLIFTGTIIVYVGLQCYKYGKIYSLQILGGDETLSIRINNILLLCYYLFNLGYCLLTLYNWGAIDSWAVCLAAISLRTGTILISIGILHLINIAAILYIAHKQKYFSPQNK